MTDGFANDMESRKRHAYQKRINRIWNTMAAERFAELSREDKKLGEIMMNHPEYHEYFQDDNLFEGQEHPADDSFSPFLHLSLHAIIEDQVAAGTPAEAALLCEYIESRGYPRHEGIHVIMTILINLIFAAQKNNQPFDGQRYQSLLAKCRKVAPAEMYGVVAREFTAH